MFDNLELDRESYYMSGTIYLLKRQSAPVQQGLPFVTEPGMIAPRGQVEPPPDFDFNWISMI